MRHPWRLATGGPYLARRLPLEQKLDEGRQVWLRHVIAGEPIRQVAAELGLSTSTAWRRSWFYTDVMVWPTARELPRSHVPPQRGTRACPRGEPPTLERISPRARIRHPMPVTRCRAHRRDRRPCRRWARRGTVVCPSHGANAPQVRSAAARRVAVAEWRDRELRARLRHHRDLRVADIRIRVLAHDLVASRR